MIARLMGLKTVSPAELLRRIERDDVTVVDVNAPASWRSARVPGACSLDAESFTACHLPDDPRRPLVFYCSNPLCRKAPRAALRARKMGFEDVAVLAAGIRGWKAGGFPVESGGEA